LDERGEAPPPYVAGAKPPGFGEAVNRPATGTGLRIAGGGDLGVRDAGGGLPGYQETGACLDRAVGEHREHDYHEHEVWSQVDIGDLRRPGPVLTPSST